MIRVGIIGCGKIADAHLSQIQRIRGCEVVGVCDREILMAGQLAERFGVGYHCSDVDELLSKSRPRIIHITTPPQSHFAIASQCMEAGCSVYVEKPFTVNAVEAQKLIEIAQATGQCLTVGHNTQFSPVARQMRAFVDEGFLGGTPVHMESFYCYNLGDARFAKALLGDKDHWARRLPGRLLHNVISHGIGKIAEYLPGDSPTVIAHGFRSEFLERLGEKEIIDELRVIIHGDHGTTAQFVFSSQMSPRLHQFRLYGPKNSLVADHIHQTLLRLPGANYKSYLNQFIPPFGYAKQYAGAGWRNIKEFLHRRFHEQSGMHLLIESFYRSVEEGADLPIPYRDILLTARIMDSVFAQIP